MLFGFVAFSRTSKIGVVQVCTVVDCHINACSSVLKTTEGSLITHTHTHTQRISIQYVQL